MIGSAGGRCLADVAPGASPAVPLFDDVAYDPRHGALEVRTASGSRYSIGTDGAVVCASRGIVDARLVGSVDRTGFRVGRVFVGMQMRLVVVGAHGEIVLWQTSRVTKVRRA